MSRVYTISDENIRMLRDIQVSFQLNGGLVEIVQLETHSAFTGDYQILDIAKFSPSNLARLEELCACWINGQCFSKDFNNDDLTIA